MVRGIHPLSMLMFYEWNLRIAKVVNTYYTSMGRTIVTLNYRGEQQWFYDWQMEKIYEA